MIAPRIEIELDKLAHNARKLMESYGDKGISVTAITKGVCGSPEIAITLRDSGVHSFGDSHLANIQKIREAGVDAQFILTRSPMSSEIKSVIEFADVSLNTEITIIRLIAKHAVKRGKTHQIILMIELGDLREGVLPSNVESIVTKVMGLRGIKLIGLLLRSSPGGILLIINGSFQHRMLVSSTTYASAKRSCWGAIR